MVVHGGHDLCHKTKFSEENFLSNLVMQFPETHMLALKKKKKGRKSSDKPLKSVNSTEAMVGMIVSEIIYFICFSHHTNVCSG